MENSKVTLVSHEGERVETNVKAVRLSLIMKEMLDTIGTTSKDTEIPLNEVKTDTLKKIVEWLEHSVDIPQPSAEEIKEKIVESIPQWDQDFLEMPLAELYDLIAAANFLNIPGLLWLTTRSIAYMIKGKSAEEVRTLFNIPNDWTEQELEAIRIENQWCEER